VAHPASVRLLVAAIACGEAASVKSTGNAVPTRPLIAGDVTDARKCHQTLHRPAPRKTVLFSEYEKRDAFVTQPRVQMRLRNEEAPPDQIGRTGLVW